MGKNEKNTGKRKSAETEKNVFDTDVGKTKSNSIEIPSIALPKGGGAIRGIDEKFSVNSVNGTASFSIPLPFSPARGLSPSLSLSYNSGNGNGIFGLGWNIGHSSIKRKTDKELPQYLDGIDSDTFIFSEAEDLVPEFQKENDGSFSKDEEGNYIFHEINSGDELHTIRFYRPRVEGLFARIERWVEKANGMIRWRVITRNNIVTLFGWSQNSTITDPQDDNKVFEWFPEFAYDDKGNCTNYMYKPEDESGFDSRLLHNRNRLRNGKITYTNLYLEKIMYGNIIPYKSFGDPFPSANDYLFSTIFDYGEYDALSPFEHVREWNFRSDAFSDYKAGFEIRTTRLCNRVLLFHHFSGQNEYNGLVRSVNFEYDTSNQESFTFLKSFTTIGYIKKNDGHYSARQLPAIEFEYQKHEWNTEIKTIAAGDLINAPTGIDEEQYEFTDLYNEGLAGILTEQGKGWYYKHNLGDGKFSKAELVTPKPSFTGLGKQLQLTDLEGDGSKQLVSYNSEPGGYFDLSDENEWQPFKSFKNLPNINFEEANIRMLDLNGDGKPEILISDDNVFTWYPSEGRKGFSQSQKTTKPFDEESGPHMIFADEKQTIFLADMSGDGCTDIVRIRNGEVCYWPNLGYGKFGAKVAMDNPPFFDHPDSFHPKYLQLADIDGSGSADIIYLGKNKFSCWMNNSGNTFNIIPFEIEAFPEIHNKSKVTVTDLLGSGVVCIVWSSSLSKNSDAPLRYIDLMNSRKPHLMVSYKNNLGKETSIEYTPSTKFYLEDKLAGKPWVTKLHFPVHCISKIEKRDLISGYRFVSSYKYHHGYYDHPEGEFRGFGMVEQIDAEHFEHWVKGNASNIVDAELHQEPVVSKTWIHTGAFLNRENILNQYSHEYWYEEMKRNGFPGNHNELTLPDARIITSTDIFPTIAEQLTAIEWQQALRACKGMTLRSEVFAHDAPLEGATTDEIIKQLTPYSVGTHNCVIELIQPKGKNKFAVFAVKESEAISYNYERNTSDPRIAHSLNIKLDEYGNVLESASVVYPRMLADASLIPEIQEEQNKTTIIYTQNNFTNDVLNDEAYRLRLPSEVKTFELKGVNKSSNYYTVSDFENVLEQADEVNYHQLDIAPAPGNSQKRLIEHSRTHYLQNDLSGPLPLHELESLAIPYESFQLALTPELISDIHGSKVNEIMLTEGKYVHSEGDNNWWIRSGTAQLIEGAETILDAQNRFYAVISYIDPFGAKTEVKYYGDYFLFIEETKDALGNKSKVDVFNFRTLSPQRMKDINGNLSESIADELGMVKAMAVMGKGNEADDLSGLIEVTEASETNKINEFLNAPDSVQLISLGKELLQHATMRFIYDLDVYKNTGKPSVTASVSREEHFEKNNDSPVQISFEYSNGLGQVVMNKVQAEPGLAKQVIVEIDDSITIVEVDTAANNPALLRWIGNGRTILNNKGNPVKEYEPYFSVSFQFEDVKELVETGVTTIIYYDVMGRPVKNEMPDGSFSEVHFDSWKQQIYDANDTILESSWYINRTNLLINDELIAENKDPLKEKIAADKSAKHANTPDILHFDTLGRCILTVAYNKNVLTDADEFYHTRVIHDVEGNLRSVIDARGNTVVKYKYDMLGNLVYQDSMDAGRRWMFINVIGSTLYSWDERNHVVQSFFDVLHRPIYSKVSGGEDESPLDHIFNRTVYGESLLLPDRSNEVELQMINILGMPIKHFDTGGITETEEYDFKGQPLKSSRRLFEKYKEVANWSDNNLDTDLGNEVFSFITETDALGRVKRQIAPDGSIITLSYNESSLLKSEMVTHVNPAMISTYIKDINYNEKGQRTKIIYGNDVITRFYYDKKTFGLIRLESKRQNNDPLQDLHYTYDPGGNITHIEDKNIPVTFFNNQKIIGISEFTYDALYRLINATGRENDVSLAFNNQDNWNDAPFCQNLNPGDPMSVRNYIQHYQYDEVGNIRQMRHVATNNSWTRDYNYGINNNRLISTQVGSSIYQYPHHLQHGYITIMPHLEDMGWNFQEQLIYSTRQNVNPENGTPETTYYQYDHQGQRIRKITENSAPAGMIPTRKEERIYIAGFETFRTFQTNSINFERESLSLIDEGTRFVMIETVKQNENPDADQSDIAGSRLIRFQFHNHLGSAALELDADAQVICYEEYHPYGTTSYQANNAEIRATAKRYRYTGMERDEETGFGYHSARYYLPWLGRWLSPDPIGIKDGVNVYAYVKGNPIGLEDVSGTKSNGRKKYRDDFIRRRSDVEGVRDRPGATAGEEAWKTPKRERGWYRQERNRTNSNSPGRWRLPDSHRTSGKVGTPQGPSTQVGHPIGKPHHSHGNSGGPGRPETPQDNLNKYQIEQGRKSPEKPIPFPEEKPPAAKAPAAKPATSAPPTSTPAAKAPLAPAAVAPPATPASPAAPAAPTASAPKAPAPKPVIVKPPAPKAPKPKGGGGGGATTGLAVAGLALIVRDLIKADSGEQREEILGNTAEGLAIASVVSRVPYVGPFVVGVGGAAMTGYGVGTAIAEDVVPDSANIAVGKTVVEDLIGAKPEDLDLLDVDITEASVQGVGEAVYEDVFAATPDDVEALESMSVFGWRPFAP